MRLTLVFMAAICSLVAMAHDFEAGGIYYNINSDGSTVSVTYKGSSFTDDMYRYEGNVTIPSSASYGGKTYTVTGIAASAFQMCFELTGVSIPSTVNNIQSNAFLGCSNLTSFTLPASVTFLGPLILNGCTGLNSIVVEEANTTYDSRNGCNAIIHKSTNKLLFASNSTVIPATVTAINDYAFQTLSITSVEIPESLKSIGYKAFSGCQKLDSLILHDQFLSIGANAFENCIAMKKLVIGSSVNNIGDYAFYKCSALQSVTTRIKDPDAVVYANGSSAYTHIFDYVNRATIPLYIPHGTLNAYKADFHWNDFKNMIEVIEVPGDVTQDGYTNVSDVTALYNFIIYGGDFTYYNTMDVNGDGYRNSADVTAVYNYILGTTDE